MKKYKIAVLGDYQNVALESADWSVLRNRADIAVFQNHLDDPDAVMRLLPTIRTGLPQQDSLTTAKARRASNTPWEMERQRTAAG
jgi:hypothetical protein